MAKKHTFEVKWLGIAICLAAIGLSGCNFGGTSDEPRDKKGNGGSLTWRIVSGENGQAAFLSRPGSAPDVVLWCKRDGAATFGGNIVLRAHVFTKPDPQPNLRIDTAAGSAVFLDVRRQGGVREGDRHLVEGIMPAGDPKVRNALAAMDSFKLSSGAQTYDVSKADTGKVIPVFIAACATPGTSNEPAQK